MSYFDSPLFKKIQQDMTRPLSKIPNSKISRISEAAVLFDNITKKFPGLFTHVENNNVEFTNQIGDTYYLNQTYDCQKLNEYMSKKNFICVVYHLDIGCESGTANF